MAGFDLGDLTKQNPISWVLGLVGIGGGVFSYLTAHAKAKPDMAEVGVSAMKATFDELRAEISRMETREAKLVSGLSQLREDRHKLRNALGKLEAYAYNLARYARALRQELLSFGIPLPAMGMTDDDIDALLNGPVPVYRPDDPEANRGEV